MTEEKEKTSEKLLKEFANLKAEMKAEIQALKTSNKPSETEHKKEGHETIEEMLECPNCYPKLRDGVVKKEGLQKPIGKRDSKEYPIQCKGCGLNVKKDEKECPNCGDTHAY